MYVKSQEKNTSDQKACEAFYTGDLFSKFKTYEILQY